MSKRYFILQSHAYWRRALRERFYAYEALIVLYLLFLSILEAIGAARPLHFLSYGIMGIIALSLPAFSRYGFDKVRFFSPMAFIPILFTETLDVIPRLHSFRADDILIQWDLFLFGVDPSMWMHQFSHPVFTEYLQILYVTFFFIHFPLAITLVKEKREQDTEEVVFLVTYGFILSYLGYIVMPAIGPRFTLHDYSLINEHLPGVLLAEPIRDTLHLLEGVVALDCFPSGHTDLTLIALYLAWKKKRSVFWGILPVGISIIISTIYLRYHYGVDLLAGALFAVVSIKSAPYAASYLRRGAKVLQDGCYRVVLKLLPSLQGERFNEHDSNLQAQ